MKKFLKVLVILILSVFLILLILPFAFQGKISQLAKEEINNNVNAQVDFQKLSLSFISSFPNVEISLHDLSVIGIDDFKNDSLAYFGEISANISPMDLFQEPIQIKSILIDRPFINAMVLKNEKANWDIAKESTETEEIEEATTEKTSSETSAFGLRLQEFRINDAKVVYRDEISGMSSIIEDLDFILSGDLSADRTTLNTQTQIKSLSFQMDGINYLNKTQISLDADLDADLKNSKYTFIDNLLRVNALELGFNGWVSMPSDDIEMDMSFETKQSDFKHILSMIPAIYMQDFQDLKTSGTLALNGEIKGIYNDNRMPAFDMNLLVDNARFQYPDLPTALENIQMDLNIANKDGIDDHTLINLKNFHIEMAQNPFDMQMKISTPVSDPNIDGKVKGIIDLDKFKDLIPSDDMKVGGIIESDIEIKGKLSSIENEKYEDFHAVGKLQMKNFKYEDQDFPQGIDITTAKAVLSPQYITLNELKGKTGSSDFSLSGELDHMLGWYFNQDVLKGHFNFYAQHIELADFMGTETEETLEESETSEAVETTETAAMEVIEIPANIEFVLQSKIDELIYDSIEISNMKGKITLKDSKAALENLNMKMLDGKMEMNGYYSSKNIEKPAFSFDINAQNIDAKKSFNAFNTIQKLAPIGKYAQGNISAQMDISGLMMSDMEVDLSSINSKGRLLSDNLSIKNADILNQISSLIKSNKFKQLSLKDMNLSYEMKDGKLEVKPFDTKIGKSTATFGGYQSLDQSIHYNLDFNIPSSEFGSEANAVANSLLGEAGKFGVDLKVPETIKFKTIIGGTLSQPKLTLDSKNQAANMADEIKKQAEQKLKEEADKAKKKAIEEAQKKANQLLAEAEKQGKKLVTEAEKIAGQATKEAYKQADAAKKEAYKQADALVKEAGDDVMKKMLAEAAAKKIKTEADNSANKIKSEADKQAQKKVQLAKDQSNKLKNTAKKQGDALINKAKNS